MPKAKPGKFRFGAYFQNETVFAALQSAGFTRSQQEFHHRPWNLEHPIHRKGFVHC